MLALAAAWSARDGELRAGWLAEIDRVSAPDGALVLALGPAGGPIGDAFAGDQLRARYPVVTVIGETSFLGVSFLLEGSEDMAIAGDLAGLAAGVRRQLVVCARQAEAPWLPRESVLVPVADPGYVARLRQLTAENDELRERLLALEEEPRNGSWPCGRYGGMPSATWAGWPAARPRPSWRWRSATGRWSAPGPPSGRWPTPRRPCGAGAWKWRRSAANWPARTVSSTVPSVAPKRPWIMVCRIHAHTLDLSALLLYLLASARSWRNW